MEILSSAFVNVVDEHLATWVKVENLSQRDARQIFSHWCRPRGCNCFWIEQCDPIFLSAPFAATQRDRPANPATQSPSVHDQVKSRQVELRASISLLVKDRYLCVSYYRLYKIIFKRNFFRDKKKTVLNIRVVNTIVSFSSHQKGKQRIIL